MSPWLSPNVVGVTATTAAPIAITATATYSAREGRQRNAARIAIPTSSAPRLERLSVSTRQAHSTASAPIAIVCSRRGKRYSSVTASSTIVSAR